MKDPRSIIDKHSKSVINIYRQDLHHEMQYRRESGGRVWRTLGKLTADFVENYGDLGGEIAYRQLNSWVAGLDILYGRIEENEEYDERSCGELEALIEEIHGVLDALTGWCAESCRIGSGNYGRLRRIEEGISWEFPMEE